LIVAVLLIASSTLTGVALAPPSQAASVGLTDPQTGKIVSDDPANFTPNILNGTVYSIVQVGNTVIVGGSFTQAQNVNSSTTLTRNHVLAFNATTGVISTTFNPGPNGTVYKVQQTGDGNTVYVAGSFTQAAGGANKNLVKLDVTSGAKVSGFAAPNIDGAVRDLEVVGNHLFVAGKFTHLGGKAQKALGTLNATTGVYDPFFTNVLAGLHRTGYSYDVTDVLQISSNPQNTQLTAVGNFTSVNGQTRSQIASFDLSGATATLSPWFTNQYTQSCSGKFDTYMTDVEYSQDGSYFIVSTTGAYGGSGSNQGTSGCDVVSRFESNGTGGPTSPTWTAYTGGDTTWNVEVTDNVIYAGGHMRWQNNPTAGDKAGQGAVARTGIASLNPVNGMTYAWNPTRTRGVGIQDMLATPQGLWVGSDTDRIGNYEYHSEIALMPLTGGEDLPPMVNMTLPNNVYSVSTGGNQLQQRTFDGTTASSPANAPNGPVAWNTTVGAFMVNGVLYTATSNGQLSKQTFDGTTYGASSPVNAADALVPQTDWHNTDVPSLTSLFYYDGRMFFTRSGQNSLFRRGFETEDDVVGQQRLSSSPPAGINYSTMRGAFVANDTFYYANNLGQLFKTGWSGTAPTGAPVQVSGLGIDLQNWSARDLFVYQSSDATPPPPPTNQPPTAVANVTCTLLHCDYSSVGSTDSDGTIVSYLWNFGDGNTSTDPNPSHDYLAAGPEHVTLKVTDDDGAPTTVAKDISPSDTVSPVAFVGADETNGNRTSHTVTVPASTQAGDAMVLFFTANTTTPTYSGTPAGWTQIGGNIDGSGILGRAYYRVATATDAGSTVKITSSAYAKSDMAVSVYRGTDGANPIGANAAVIDNTTTAAHTSPTLTAPADGKWLVTYWVDKSTNTSAWTPPSDQQFRSNKFGTSGGHLSGLLVDSGADVSGSTGGLTATANSSTNRALSFSIVLR
jgi:hypothetical protein